MPDPDILHGLLCAANDELQFLEAHLELLEIAIEQLENSDAKVDLRASLLVTVFLSNARCHYQELRMHLRQAFDEVAE